MEQISPCSVMVEYATFAHRCGFPFPITGDSVRLRVPRPNDWMEVINPLINSTNHISTAFPLQSYNLDSEVATWKLPYINFDRLPKLGLRDAPSEERRGLWRTLLSMFTDREWPLRAKKQDLLKSIKNSFHDILDPAYEILLLRCEKQTISFLLIDEYLDFNSHWE